MLFQRFAEHLKGKVDTHKKIECLTGDSGENQLKAWLPKMKQIKLKVLRRQELEEQVSGGITRQEEFKETGRVEAREGFNNKGIQIKFEAKLDPESINTEMMDECDLASFVRLYGYVGKHVGSQPGLNM